MWDLLFYLLFEIWICGDGSKEDEAKKAERNESNDYQKLVERYQEMLDCEAEIARRIIFQLSQYRIPLYIEIQKVDDKSYILLLEKKTVGCFVIDESFYIQSIFYKGKQLH